MAALIYCVSMSPCVVASVPSGTRAVSRPTRGIPLALSGLPTLGQATGVNDLLGLVAFCDQPTAR
jgi:hypothetical protein